MTVLAGWFLASVVQNLPFLQCYSGVCPCDGRDSYPNLMCPFAGI